MSRDEPEYDDDSEYGENQTIEDLLGFEDEPPPRERRSSGRGAWWIKSILVAAGLAAVTVFGARIFGYTVPIPVVVAVFLALLILRRVTGSLVPLPANRVRRPSNGTEDGSYNFGGRDALRSVVARYERLLERAGADARAAQAGHRAIADIADERLRQRHGVSRQTDPDRARGLLGDPLWHYLHTPPKKTLASKDAATYAQSLERL